MGNYLQSFEQPFTVPPGLMCDSNFGNSLALKSVCVWFKKKKKKYIFFESLESSWQQKTEVPS